MALVVFLLLAGWAADAPTLRAQSAFAERLQGLYHHPEWLIEPEALHARLSAGQDVLLLDTRSPDEYRLSHLPGAVRVDWEAWRPAAIDSLSRERVVVAYCTVGWRSEQVTERLRAAGFDRSYNLYGSIIAWSNRGYPLHNARGHATEKVHTYSRSWARYLEQGEAVYEWWKLW
jgi:rhodanese-related sulfurtransferase